MKKLLLVAPLVLAACSGAQSTRLNSLVPDLYIASPQGAGFGPYSAAEYHVRKADGQPGIIREQEPWTYKATKQQRRANKWGKWARKSKPDVKVPTNVVEKPSGFYTRSEAVDLATSTPTTYRLSKNETYTVTRKADGSVVGTYQYLVIRG